VRLYERYGQTAPDPRAVAAARSLEKMFGFGDRDHVANPFSPVVEWIDHRLAGVGTLRGDGAVLAAVRAFLDLVESCRWRADDVLAWALDALLTRSTNLGIDRASGGSFERTILSLVVFDARGLIKQ